MPPSDGYGQRYPGRDERPEVPPRGAWSRPQNPRIIRGQTVGPSRYEDSPRQEYYDDRREPAPTGQERGFEYGYDHDYGHDYGHDPQAYDHARHDQTSVITLPDERHGRAGADEHDDGASGIGDDGPPRRPTSHRRGGDNGRDKKPKKGKKFRTPAQRRRRKIIWRSVLAVFVVFVGMVSWSVGRALTAPGTDTVEERLAEWARDHGLGSVVTWLENQQYNAHKPKVGGAPPPGEIQQLEKTQIKLKPKPHGVPIRAAIPTFVTPAQPGEGVWQPLVMIHGQPAIQDTFMRPDAEHTSYLSGLVWIDQKLTRYVMHPGFQEPGGSGWPEPDEITPDERAGLVATWNGGFRMQDAKGGFYEAGQTVGTLEDGKASEVIYRNGSMTVGSWNQEVRMTPDVVAVRQNLQLLVDNGQVSPLVNDDSESVWGVTISNKDYVWRSGVGITPQGDVIYVTGNALSVGSLAALLQRAGCERAMELDINPDWVSFMSYTAAPHDPTNVTPAKLVDFLRPADRYFQQSSRDFMAVYAR